MRILPVIDIKDGIVVRGVAGTRDLYRPLESGLTSSHDVIDVAESLREHFKIDELYIADLDAILNDRPHDVLYETLSNRGFRLLVDAGLREVTRAQQLKSQGAAAVIAGLETAPVPEFLTDLCTAVGSESLIFSLDMQQGKPLSVSRKWRTDPVGIAEQAAGSGVRRMIVLDLAAVGVSAGLSTLELCRTIGSRYPEMELLTGGGVRNVEDLRAIQTAGVQGVLIASALHNGSLTRTDLAEFA